MGGHSKQRPCLDGRRYDVVVIGGGINGVAIARECARGGRRVLVLEQNDFAGATTSRATRIIHGGLRYLETGDLALVRESLRERARLAEEKPHLVHPLQFVLPIGPGSRRSSLEIRLGLWLYSRLGGRFGSQRRADVNTIEKLLSHSGHWTLFSYDDAQCEFPERLAADWLAEACQAGAEARNYCQALEVLHGNGRACRIRLRDLLSGEEANVHFDWVINATGPWVDHVCNASDLMRSRPLIGGVRGSHIVLPRFAGAPDAAIYGEAPDGRPIFMIPWNEQILVGTTEVPDGRDPSTVQPSEIEIEYLFAWLKRFFPFAPVSRHDMLYAYAGVRPLPFAPGQTASQVTRRHIVHDHEPESAQGMLSIVGGKLTTAASLAREVARRIGVGVKETRGLAFAAATEGLVENWIAFLIAETNLPPEIATAIARLHGPAASTIAATAARDPRQRLPLCEGTPHIVAEAVYALQHEHAVHLGDVLLRRVPVALAGWWSADATRMAGQRIGAAMRWSSLQIEAEIELFEIERAQMLYRDYGSAPIKKRA